MNVVCCRAPKDNTSKEVTGALDMKDYNNKNNNDTRGKTDWVVKQRSFFPK